MALFLMLSMEAEAATVQYSVRYVKEHLFYHDDGQMNVIDLNLEWPDIIDGDRVDSLKSFIIERLFGFHHHDFDAAYAQFKDIFGKPVTQPLDSLPDDDKYCYVDLSLRLLGHAQGRFASFEISGSCNPGPKSKFTKQEVSILITYDIEKQRILRRNQLLHYEDMWKDFFTTRVLLMHAYVDGEMKPLYIHDACMVDNGILLRVEDEEDLNALNDVIIDASNMGGYLTRTAKKLLKPLKKSKREPQVFELPHQWKGEPVLDKAEVMPTSMRKDVSLPDMIKQNLQVPEGMEDSGIHGKVKLSVLIDQDGLMHDVRVVEPLEPSFDREAVKAVRALPRWNPGMELGQPVNVRATISLVF